MSSGGIFKYGLCECTDSCSDCLLAFLCPAIYAFVTARNADDDSCLTPILNCLCWPACLCCLRNKVSSSLLHLCHDKAKLAKIFSFKFTDKMESRNRRKRLGGCCCFLVLSMLCHGANETRIRLSFSIINLIL